MPEQPQQSFANRLYSGSLSFRIIVLRRRWYAGSLAILLIGVISLAVRGLNPSIDFKGGAVFEGPLHGHSVSQVRDAVSGTGITPEEVTQTGSGSSNRFDVETVTLTQPEVVKVEQALAAGVGVTSNQLDVSTVGSTWGGQITDKAIEGLLIFLAVTVVYLSVRFEWRMAVAAIVALIHDLVITAGIYSLFGLQVSPSTVIALLTILGYSLYDTVVVFDKVRENTNGLLSGSRSTYSQAANLAVNQTLVRSINTSVIALLPVIGLLVIGVGVLGAGSLEDLSVALLIGLAAGAYSSIFIATPLLCDIKEREPAYVQLARRVAQRAGRGDQPVVARRQPAAVAAAGSGSPAARSAPEVAGDPELLPDVDPETARRRAATAQRRAASRPGGRGARSRRRR